MTTRITHAQPATNIGAKPLAFAPEQFKQFANLAEAFYFNAVENPDAIAYDQALRDDASDGDPRKYRAITHAQCRARVLQLAAFLEVCGVANGAAVAVLSHDRPEWTEAEMAVYTVGARVVPAYVRDTPERLGHIVRDAGATFAFVENQQQLEKLLRLAADDDRLQLRHIIAFERVATSQPAIPVTSLHDILQGDGAARPERSFAWTRTPRDELACIYYTSGSSGQPKGVPATHGQILSNLYQIAAAEMVDYEPLRLAGVQPIVTFVLPERAHAFPSRSAQLVFTSPARARYPAIVDPTCSEIDDAYRDSVRRDLREAGAGMIPVVPKIAMAIEQRVRHKLAAAGMRGRFARAIIENDVAKSLRDVRSQRGFAGDALHLLFGPLRRRLARRIRGAIVGPQFEYFISGGAKLPLETAAFLHAIGLPIHEGYGSTETNCPIASSTPRQHRLGSVGKLFREIEVKIDPLTRELLVKGPNVVSGYLNCDDESRANWDSQGWYHTRDVAALDAEGFLQIEERLDNMMVLLNGENVSPVAIENRCAAIAGVESAIVIGDHRPVLVALFVLSEQAVQHWAASLGHRLALPWQRDPHVVAWLRREIELQVNTRAGHPYECIRHAAIIEPLSIQQQTLTATEKVRRREIERRYAGLISQLYADADHWLSPGPRVSLAARRVAAL